MGSSLTAGVPGGVVDDGTGTSDAPHPMLMVPTIAAAVRDSSGCRRFMTSSSDRSCIRRVRILQGLLCLMGNGKVSFSCWPPRAGRWILWFSG